jgi:oxygen-independent coproporphyrinogen-3 oxidase
MRQVLGLYIHIPFCKRKCNYCDFYSVAADPDRIRRYVDAVITDMQQKAAMVDGSIFDSLFIGGGTPSVMGSELIRIIEAAHQCFSFSQDAEMTCEANPESLTYDFLVDLKRVGINRISIGAQSFCDEELHDLGRLHNRQDIIRAHHDICRAGFENINIDIMFGVGHKLCNIEHLEAFSNTLDQIISLNPPHLSCYNLTIQEDTVLHRDLGAYCFADEDTEERMYQMLCDKLATNGYDHYEISNFAKPGFACKHNIKYWKSQPYLGIGPAAHTFMNNIRYSQKPDLTQYLLGNGHITTEEILCPEDLAKERLILGLRMREGVRWQEIESFFDVERLSSHIKELSAHELMIIDNCGFSLTEKGFRVSNSIINYLLSFNRR